MEKLSFYDLEDFCKEISCRFDNLNSDDFEDISIIAKYEEAKIIIEELICDGFTIHALEIHDKEWEGYEAEYIITLCSIDDDYELFCEPMMRDGKYVKDSSTEIYILDNCSSKVIPYCYSDNLYEVAIDDEDYDGLDIEYDEEEFQCEHCCLDKCAYCGNDKDQKTSEKYVEYSHDDDGDLHGFSASKSDGNSYFGYSFYTSDRLDTNDILNLLKEMGF